MKPKTKRAARTPGPTLDPDLETWKRLGEASALAFDVPMVRETKSKPTDETVDADIEAGNALARSLLFGMGIR